MVNNTLSDSELKDKILNLQTRMITVGILKGLTHPDTIRYSQELDLMMNEFHKIKSKS